jgi:hypothetical protein
MSGKTRKIADVKCYYCGHISGQVEGNLGDAPADMTFTPRIEAGGATSLFGRRLRCERCGGPVYLEDVTPMSIEDTVLARRPAVVSRPATRVGRRAA